jgi:galactokinase
VLGALVDLSGADVPLEQRPGLAQRAENAYVGVPCGIMDQAASTLCRHGDLLFLDCRSLATEHVPFDLDALGLAVLVIDTRAPHRHATGEYASRRATCEAAAATLGVRALRDITADALPRALEELDDPIARRRVRHVVTENHRVLQVVAALRTGDVTAVGPVLTASHRSLRDDYEVTVPELDSAVSAALGAGALGARMTGGGFGGCAIALVEAAAAAPVQASIRAAFARDGFGDPDCFVATPARGAART